MSRQFYLYTFLLLIASSLAHTQIIPFKNYTVRDGLPSNYISDIVQDKKGYIWLATNFGLSKFDGYKFETFTIENGLSDNFINCLTTDNDGRIWAGTETGGISVVSDFGVNIVNEKNGLFSDAVELIFTDKQNNVWACGRQNGVSIIKKDTVITFKNENSILQSNIFCHLVDSKGIVWLGTYDGIFYFDSIFHQLKPNLLSDITVWAIIEDRTGCIWFASETNGVFCLNGDELKNYNTENGLTSNTTLSLIEDNKGRILIGTYLEGINIIEKGVINNSLVDATKEYWIWGLFIDSKNRIWARTHEQGIILVQNNKTNYYSKENHLVSQFILDIFEDTYGNLWFTSEDGISLYGKTFFEIFTNGFVDDNSNILSIHINSENKIFTGTYNGLTVSTPNKENVFFSSTNGLPDDASVFKIIPDNNTEMIWLATNGLSILKENKISHFPIKEKSNEEHGINTLDLVIKQNVIYAATELGLYEFSTRTKKYIFLTEENGLINNDIYSLALDNNSNIWCGTKDGISVYNGEKFNNFTTFNGLPNNLCNDITFDAKGVAWIATDYGLCSAILSDDFTLSTRNYSTKNGLNSNSIASVISDNNGNIWVGHNKGIDCLNPITSKIKNYGFNEGFLPIECNLGAIAKDKEDNIWFGTINGIVKYSSENDNDNSHPPEIYIKNIQLYNDTASIEKYYSQIDTTTLLPKELRLHYSKKNIYFNYVGLHYTIVEKNTYKYRLLGYDENWSKPTTEIQSIPYQKLPHGSYTFQVMAANCDGVWTKEPAEFSFEILPPFWKTWWFRVIEIISAIVLFYIIIYLRERKLRNDKKELTQKVKERTLEVVKQKDQIEIQRDEIVKQKKEITDSIQYAQHIQSAILPKQETISPLLKDYFILYKPRDIVSGDFYWINGKNNKVIAIAADCTGHGVPGAFMSMLGVSILNEITTKKDTNAGQILDTLREHIIATLSHTRQNEEARDGMDLALSIIDYNTHTLQFAGAYNPLILIRNGEAEVFKADKMPVGSHSGDLIPFSTQEIKVLKGDCLYMFSDGYADQFGGPDGKKFMSKNFRNLLIENSNKTMEEQKNILDTTLEDWMNGYEQVDDILVMGIRMV